MINWIIKFLKSIWSLPVILGALGIAGLLLISSQIIISSISLPANPVPTLDLYIISAPTRTPVLARATVTVVPSPTSNFVPSPEPGVIGVGGFVQIVGTAGTGLNIRDEAGLTSNVNFLAYDEEAFGVEGGPIEVDGFTWWFIVTPVDDQRSGWAAETYLSVIPNP